MARQTEQITGYLAGWSEAQYEGTKNTFNSSIAIDPDHSLTDSGIRTSGMLVPVVYEKFSSSLLVGNAKWVITNPKNTLIYAYSDNPDASTAVELASNSLFSDPNLKAYYKFTASALTTDSGPNTKTLTNNNVVAENVSGKFNGCADFGSANTNKSLSIADSLSVDGVSITISLWVKLNTEITTGAYGIVGQSSATSKVYNYITYQYNAGTRRLAFRRLRNGVATEQANYTVTLGTSAFHHIAYVYDGTNVLGYYDGALVASVASSGSGSSFSTDGFEIGRDYDGAFGSILTDDVAVLNRALSIAEIQSIYQAGAKFLSYSSALGSETVVASPASATGNGLAYYNNYIYIATNTDIARYGPLNGTPAYTASVWTGATLGSLTALTNTTYGFQSSYAFPNHPMVVHGDGALYVCDYINGAGKIHRVKTTKTTFEGDTNNVSAYGALTLPFGFLPTDIQSYGTDLVILAVQTTDTVINQGRAAMFFWDASATTFYRGPLYLPDSLATALEIMNGYLYIWSGNASGGVRLSKYIGGDSIQEILFQEEGTPPPPGATSVYGNRIYWGNHITYPADVLGVFSWGSKTERLPAGLHCVARANNTTTTMPAITALVPAEQANGSRNRLLIAWRDSAGYGISKLSTTGTHIAVWRSEIVNVGGKFKIEEIRIPLGAAVTTNMSIIPKVLIDDASTTVTLPTISTTLYDGARKVEYYSLELNECLGQNNFMLELNWSGTAALPVTTPIVIIYDDFTDENVKD